MLQQWLFLSKRFFDIIIGFGFYNSKVMALVCLVELAVESPDSSIFGLFLCMDVFHIPYFLSS